MPPALPSSSTHYAIVIDAGSSGSRLQIYSWRDPDLERAEILAEVRQARKEASSVEKASGSSGERWWWASGKDGYRWKGKGKESETEMEMRALRRLVRVGKGVEGDDWVKRVEPGISTVEPDEIPSYLAPLMLHAMQHIPPSQHASTPVYVLATAGMRLLAPERQSAILSATCETLRRRYPFAVGQGSSDGACGENVRIISGEEEGMWGWVAVNYLMDGFGHAPEISHMGLSEEDKLLPIAPLATPPSNSWGSSDSVTPVDVNHHSPTFGFLDMGGASTQLAFSPSADELARSGFPESELQHVSLRLLSGEKVDWPVFIASWLGFGTNRARERYADDLIERWRASQGPGMTPDLSEPIRDPCLPVDLVIPSANPSSEPDIIGTGSFTTCLSTLRPLLDHDAPCPTAHCLFGGIPTPHIDFQRDDQRGFIGISEYWYTAEQVLGLGGVWDWTEWERGMNAYCARSWGDIKSSIEGGKGWRGAEVELSRLQMQCFKGAWISNVLHEGIGIPRIVDAGGNTTLVEGGTNAEADRRAREKGLQDKNGHNGHHHFQAIDEVDNTAISWTLGKVVIEASKGVGPWKTPDGRSSQPLSGVLDLDLDRKFDGMGVGVVGGYTIFALIFIIFAAFTFRRRLGIGNSFNWITGSLGLGGRSSRRIMKSPLLASTSAYSMEDGIDLSTGLPSSLSSSKLPRGMSPPVIGRLRLWSRRVEQLIRKLPVPFPSLTSTGSQKSISPGNGSVGGSFGRDGLSFFKSVRGSPGRHGSLPTVHTSNLFQSSALMSQPPSPRGSISTASNFGGGGSGISGNSVNMLTPPALTASLNVPIIRPLSTSPELRGSRSALSLSASASSVDITSTSSPMGLSATSSPPRLKNGSIRPSPRPRQNSSTYLACSVGGGTSGTGAGLVGDQTMAVGPGSGGWNDPPINMFNSSSSASSSGIYEHPSGLMGNTLSPHSASLAIDGFPNNNGTIGLSNSSLISAASGIVGGGGGAVAGGGSLNLHTMSSGVLTPTASSVPEFAISRNSSRVNLSDMLGSGTGSGLAQRSSSRATTPMFMDEDCTP